MRRVVDLLICTALRREFEAVRSALGCGVVNRLPFRHTEFTDSLGQSRAIVQMGVGNERAIKAVEWANETFDPKKVLLAGYCGGLNPELSVGCVLCFSPFEDPTSAAEFDRRILDHRAVAMGPDGIRIGPLLCVNAVIHTTARKRELWEATGAEAIDMESAAVVAACRAQQIPCQIMKVLSDTAKDSIDPRLASLVGVDGEVLRTAVVGLLWRPDLWLNAVRLGRAVALADSALQSTIKSI